MSQPVLLTYNLPREAASKYNLAAMRMKIRIRPVKPEEYGKPLGALCGAAPDEDKVFEGEGFSDPMLVMANFPGAMMNLFLQSARRMGAPMIPLKAVLTPTNAGWDSVTLHDEIAKEHEAMKSGGQAHE